MKPDVTVKRIPPIHDLNPPRRHRDPSPGHEPFEPRPVSRPAQPRMSSPVGENVLPGDVGGQYEFRHPGGKWFKWGMPGKPIEVRIVAAEEPKPEPRPKSSAEFLKKLGE